VFKNTANTRIAQTFIETLVREFAKSENIGEDYAFELISAGIILDQDPNEIPPEELIDSPDSNSTQDKQIDVVHIEVDENNGVVDITLIQSKNSASGVAANTVIKMSNGLNWIFEETNLDRVASLKLRNKIEEIRNYWQTYTGHGLQVRVCIAFKGDTSNIAPEVQTELNRLKERFERYFQIEIELYGANEIYQRYESNARNKRRVDAEIPLTYDENQPSVMEHTIGSTKAVICTVSGRELAKLVDKYGNSVFDQNLRPYLGVRGDVNRSILDTLKGKENASGNFWFLNNGVTMICDDYSISRVPGMPKFVHAQNVQIVNGCQTTVSLSEAMKSGELKDDVYVLVKIFATSDEALTQQITLTTNNQNRITNRDLRANDIVQRQIQAALKNYGFNYERKSKEFGEMRGRRELTLVPNYRAAQAYFAIALKNPSIARGYPGRVWDEAYKRIFSDGSTAEAILLCYLLYRYCFNRSRTGELSVIQNEVAVYGAFHLARIMGYLVTDDNWGMEQTAKLVTVIEAIKQNEDLLGDYYEKAISIILPIWEKEKPSSNPTLYFKTDAIQQTIELALKAQAEES